MLLGIESARHPFLGGGPTAVRPVTELVFADRDDLSARMAGLGADEIARDEENFIDRAATRAYVVDERSSAGRAGRQQRQQLCEGRPRDRTRPSSSTQKSPTGRAVLTSRRPPGSLPWSRSGTGRSRPLPAGNTRPDPIAARLCRWS